MDPHMNPHNENIDLFKAQKQTKWKARLADRHRHLASMHFDNPDADKTTYNFPKQRLIQATGAD